MQVASASLRWTIRRGGALVVVALLALCSGRARGAVHDPCNPEGTDARSAGAAAGITAPSGDDSKLGYVIIQSLNERFLGRGVFLKDHKLAEMSSTKGQCVWIPMSPGRHQIRIASLPTPKELTVDIVQQRTLLVSISEDGGADKALLPRFGLQVQGSLPGLSPGLRSRLLDLAAQAPAPDQMELAPELSGVEPLDKAGLSALLQRRRAPCSPGAFKNAPLQYLLVLSTDSPDRSSVPRLGVKVFHMGVGEREPAFTLKEGDAAAAECSQSQDSQRLLCFLQKALERAQGRRTACLQLGSEPPGALVSVRPIPADGQPAQGAPKPLGQTSSQGPLERVVFMDSAGPLSYELTWKLSGFFDGKQSIPLSEDEVKSVSEPLKPVPLPKPGLPWHKKWWVWQLLGTAVAVGVGGAVAGIYANDGGTP